MANQTPNYNLTKPLGIEYYDVEVQNGNMDIIDEALSAKVDKVSQSKEVVLSTTSSTVIATHDTTNGGNFELKVYLRITQSCKVTVTASYTNTTGAQVQIILPEFRGLYFPTSTGIQTYNTGSYSLTPLFINAIPSSTITITATTDKANQVHVSSSIMEV